MDHLLHWILIAIISVVVALVMLRKGWLRPRGVSSPCQRCPCGGNLKMVAMWSWSVTKDGKLVLLKAGMARDPSAKKRQYMHANWPAEAAETYSTCDECQQRFIIRKGMPTEAADASTEGTVEVRPCSQGKWLDAVDTTFDSSCGGGQA